MPRLKRYQIVLFGDSLTQQSFGFGGWGARLQDEYVRRADVFNRGYSGYNTRWALLVLDTAFTGLKPDLVTIFLGANDAARNSRQDVSLEDYEENMREIIRKIQKRTSRIILITPPPVDEKKWAKRIFEKYGEEKSDREDLRTQKYAKIVARLGSELGLPVVNLSKRVRSLENWEDLLHDGLHFDPKTDAQKFVFEWLRDEIVKAYPNFEAEPLQMESPSHADINPHMPEKSFPKPPNNAKNWMLFAFGSASVVAMIYFYRKR